MIALDTNVLVRYLVQDDKTQAAVATRLIERELSEANSGFITLMTLCELTWVLETSYETARVQVAEILEAVLSTRQFQMEDPEAARRALRFYRKTPADFADALVADSGNRAGCEAFATFDKGCAKLPGARILGR